MRIGYANLMQMCVGWAGRMIAITLFVAALNEVFTNNGS